MTNPVKVNFKNLPPLVATLQDGQAHSVRVRPSLVNEWEAPVRYRHSWTQHRSGRRVYQVRKGILLAPRSQ